MEKLKDVKSGKDFYKKVALLVIPLALQNLINVGITMADVIMLGKVSETVLSASNIAGQIQYIMMMIFFGLSSGLGVLSSQYWGKREVKVIEKIMGMAMTIAITVGIIFMLLALIIPEKLMFIYIKDSSVIEAGVSYLRIVAFSYVFIAFSMIYLNTMRSIEKVVISTIVYLVSLVVNIILNAILIFGLLGFKPMGIKGAAIATLIARIIEFIIIVVYDKKVNKTVNFHFRNLKIRDKDLLKDFIKFSMPVVANELMWGLGTTTNTAILGNYSANNVNAEAVVAANSVAQVIRQLATVVAFGIATAAAVTVGKTLGKGDTDEAKWEAKRLTYISIASGIVGGLIVLIAGPIANNVLELSIEAQGYLSMMMIVMSYFVLAQAYNTLMVVGLFRAGGDTKFGLILDISTMWGGSILVGWLAAFVFELPLVIVYIIVMSDEIIKVPICGYRYRQGKWLRNVTR